MTDIIETAKRLQHLISSRSAMEVLEIDEYVYQTALYTSYDVEVNREIKARLSSAANANLDHYIKHVIGTLSMEIHEEARKMQEFANDIMAGEKL